MSPVKINWDDAPTQVFEVHPDGLYPATVTGMKLKKSQPNEATGSKGGNPYYEVEFTLEAPATGKQWNNYSLLPQALWKFKQFLVRCGFEEDELSGDDFELNEQDVLAREVVLQVGHRDKYKGEPDPKTGEMPQQNYVVDVFPADAIEDGGWS
jgi:hypothetical protein